MNKTLPIPRISKITNKHISTQGQWYCNSEEYCTWDGLHGFYCSGLGHSPEEAYNDWLESYLEHRWEENIE